jgi:hypothetical protein
MRWQIAGSAGTKSPIETYKAPSRRLHRDNSASGTWLATEAGEVRAAEDFPMQRTPPDADQRVDRPRM